VLSTIMAGAKRHRLERWAGSLLGTEKNCTLRVGFACAIGREGQCPARRIPLSQEKQALPLGSVPPDSPCKPFSRNHANILAISWRRAGGNPPWRLASVAHTPGVSLDSKGTVRSNSVRGSRPTTTLRCSRTCFPPDAAETRIMSGPGTKAVREANRPSASVWADWSEAETYDAPSYWTTAYLIGALVSAWRTLP
jgi:hypothetical protein